MEGELRGLRGGWWKECGGGETVLWRVILRGDVFYVWGGGGAGWSVLWSILMHYVFEHSERNTTNNMSLLWGTFKLAGRFGEVQFGVKCVGAQGGPHSGFSGSGQGSGGPTWRFVGGNRWPSGREKGLNARL